MMTGKTEPHPTDEGKFQSAVDKYGHGKGNGKSKTAIYKHLKNGASEPVGIEEADDDVPDESSWDSIEWLTPEEEEDAPSTIPRPIQRLAVGEVGELGEVHKATQKQIIKWGFMGLDRGITHWGRGVTGNDKYEVPRSANDYEAMEGATSNLLEAHGISLDISPTLAFAVVMGAAYVPPVVHISRNADPERKSGIFNRVKRMLVRRRRAKPRIIEE